jgi:hypothetical protein
MDTAEAALPAEKDNKAVKAYFEQVYPNMDFDRVYSSDMKKMVRWFGVIKQQNIEIVLPEMDEEEEGKEG